MAKSMCEFEKSQKDIQFVCPDLYKCVNCRKCPVNRDNRCYKPLWNPCSTRGPCITARECIFH